MSSTGMVEPLRNTDRWTCCDRRTAYIAVSVEWSRRMLLMSAMSWQSSTRYVDALPDRHWHQVAPSTDAARDETDHATLTTTREKLWTSTHRAHHADNEWHEVCGPRHGRLQTYAWWRRLRIDKQPMGCDVQLAGTQIGGKINVRGNVRIPMHAVALPGFVARRGKAGN